MDDKVKITVIATGFQRDSLPDTQRSSAFGTALEASSNGSGSHESEPENAAVVREGEQPPPDDSANDVDMPAYLRKKRQLVQ